MAPSITITKSAAVSLISGLESFNGISRPRLPLNAKHVFTKDTTSQDYCTKYCELCVIYDTQILCPVPPSVLSQRRRVRVLKYNVGRQSFHLLYVLLNGSVLCSVFLSSPLCLISHLAFPLCAALVIVFLWSALAFDMQTPKTLAALQINCL